MTALAQPVPTDGLTEPGLPDGVIELTQYYGEFDQKERAVWVRVAAISHFTEHTVLMRVGHPRGAVVHLLNGESFRVTESPEAILASLP